MLIHLETRKIKDNVLDFDLPYINFNPNKTYTLNVREFYLKVQPAIRGGPYLISLSTNLIQDRSTNSYQEILSSLLIPKQKFVYVIREPNFLEYKITRTDFSSSQFYLTWREKNVNSAEYQYLYAKLIIDISEH